MKKIFENIIFILLGISIVISSILIGAPFQENYKIMYIIIAIITIIAMIYSLINKKRFFINNIDIFVFLLAISSFWPLIFNTYTSLNDEVISIFRYLSIFGIYNIAKIIIGNDYKKIRLITLIVIMGAILLTIIGIDDLAGQNFWLIKHKLNIVDSLNLANRMISNFGYANSFAGFIGFCYILNIGMYISSNNKFKAIYTGIAFILMSAIFLSYSRSTLIILILAIMLYIIIIKEKNTRIAIIEICTISTLISIIYLNLFEKASIYKNYINIWIGLIVLFILSSLLQILLHKLNKYILNIRRKHIIIFVTSVMIIGIIVIIIGLKLVEPLTIFVNQYSSTNIEYRMPEIESNKNYKFEFNINAESKMQNINNYYIKITEQNKYGDYIKEHIIEFNSFKGIKTLEFETSNETERFLLTFQSSQPYAQKGLTINSLLINNEQYPLKYKYLPVNLVNRMKELINLKDICLSERFVYSFDALKLIKNNWIFGMGGNSWQYRYSEVQQYNYSANQIHCYIIQIFFEYGLLGVISVFGIMILILYYGIQNIKKYRENNIQIITIWVAILFILIRSFVDFDMTFMHILLMTFMYIEIFASNIECRKINLKYKKIIFAIIISMFVGVIYYNINDLIIERKLKNTEKNTNGYVQLLNEGIKKNPYNLKYKIEKYNISEDKEKIEVIKKINFTEPYYSKKLIMLRDLLDLILKEDNINAEDITMIYETLLVEANRQQLNLEKNIEVNYTIYSIAKSLSQENITLENIKLEKMINDLYKLIIKNYEKNREEILNHEKNRSSYEQIDESIKQLDEIYNNAKKELEG